MSAVYITRCSGGVPQVKISKYTMGLPGLPEKVVNEKLPDATKEENALATGPGMYGRIWLGQSLAFDEAYQILQEHMQLPDARIHPSVSCAHPPSVLYDRTQWVCCV